MIQIQIISACRSNLSKIIKSNHRRNTTMLALQKSTWSQMIRGQGHNNTNSNSNVNPSNSYLYTKLNTGAHLDTQLNIHLDTRRGFVSNNSDNSPEAEAEENENSNIAPEYQNPLHHNDPTLSQILISEYPDGEAPIAPLPPFSSSDDDLSVLAPVHLHALADEIVSLNMKEVKELVDRVADHFGFQDDDDYDASIMMGAANSQGSSSDAQEEKVEQKTTFELKLLSFDTPSKIKVIKEVRAITALGLKEAKELVESVPKLIKKDIKKEEAEELKKQLETVGAVVEII